MTWVLTEGPEKGWSPDARKLNRMITDATPTRAAGESGRARSLISLRQPGIGFAVSTLTILGAKKRVARMSPSRKVAPFNPRSCKPRPFVGEEADVGFIRIAGSRD